MKTLVKTSMKLLLRTWGFWFFLLITPFLSTVILKTNFDSSAAYESSGYDELSGSRIRELEMVDQKVAYFGGKGECVIKVYDAADSDISGYFLEKLADRGLFRICRVNLTDREICPEPLTGEALKEQIETDGFRDRMGAAIYLSPDFDQLVKEGKTGEALTIYVLSEDSRVEVLEQDVKGQLAEMQKLGYDLTALKEADSQLPVKKVVAVSVGEGGIVLDTKQTNQKTQMGYAFAFMTLGFVFCGIFVAHTSIREQKNGVYTRINLTKTGTMKYFISKFITSFFVSVMLTAVMGICSLFLDIDDMGMNRGTFLLLIFMIGMIFSSLSMLVGILIGEVMTANIAAFAIWCMSSLFSGLYFPLNGASAGVKALSSVMPQTWFLKGVEKIFVGDNSAYFMLICIAAAYLIINLSLGCLGLKLRRSNGWGNS